MKLKRKTRTRKRNQKGGTIPEAKNLYGNGKLSNTIKLNSERLTIMPYYKDPESGKKVVVALGGITGARLHSRKNNHNKKYVVKNGEGIGFMETGGWGLIQDEYAAGQIYRALGIPVPEQRLDTENKMLIVEYLEGISAKELQEQNRELFKEEANKAFAADVLLGNYDTYGSEDGGNMLYANRKLYKIDNGSTFDRAASGMPRRNFLFIGDAASQINKFRDPSLLTRYESPAASGTVKMHQGIKDAEVADQIRTMIVPKKQVIVDLTPDRLERRSNNNINATFVPRNLKVIMAERIDSLEQWADGK
jgi:hypothetical protein